MCDCDKQQKELGDLAGVLLVTFVILVALMSFCVLLLLVSGLF